MLPEPLFSASFCSQRLQEPKLDHEDRFILCLKGLAPRNSSFPSSSALLSFPLVNCVQPLEHTGASQTIYSVPVVFQPGRKSWQGHYTHTCAL